MYDYLIVGAGLWGACFAQQMTEAGKRCLVVEKRHAIGGNVRTERMEGIDVHVYGAHIFHTRMPEVWAYAQRFAVFNRYTNCPVANYHGRLFNLPFNMNTFYQMWGVTTPEQARAMIAAQQAEGTTGEPRNLEEQAIRLVGRDLYEALVKGYTEKQWGRPCDQLPAFIIRRLPVRFTFDNDYFGDPWQGIPTDGYSAMVAHMLDGIEVRLNTDYLAHRAELDALARTTVFTGPVDAFFDHQLGRLQYRSLRFETETLPVANHQGVAVMNYTDAETPFTRVIEHKHFAMTDSDHTVISREYSVSGDDLEPYYPINDDRNNALCAAYKALADGQEHVLFGGRLGEYRYYNMDQVLKSALDAAKEALRRG